MDVENKPSRIVANYFMQFYHIMQQCFKFLISIVTHAMKDIWTANPMPFQSYYINGTVQAISDIQLQAIAHKYSLIVQSLTISDCFIREYLSNVHNVSDRGK